MTINLQQAKRLNELGVRKKAQFVWFTVYADNKYWDKILYEGKLTEDDIAASETIYPAYNAEELIKLLRAKEHIQIDIYSHGDGFMFHQEGSWVAGEDDIHGSTLTEALGNKLIHDLENGIITAGEVNK